MKMTDYQQVYDVWTSCRGMGLNSVDDTQEGIDRFLKRNTAACFVAEEAGRIIGVFLTGHDGRRGYIYHTAVHPEKRGKGIGTMLVDASIQALKKRRHYKDGTGGLYTQCTGQPFLAETGLFRTG